MLFKVLDYSKTQVILTKTTWKDKLLDPIIGHPEVKRFLPKIQSAIKSPDYVYMSKRDPRSKLFFAKIKKGEFKDHYLNIVIKYIREDNKKVGYILTVMINRELPKKSKPIWQKNNLS